MSVTLGLGVTKTPGTAMVVSSNVTWPVLSKEIFFQKIVVLLFVCLSYNSFFLLYANYIVVAFRVFIYFSL